MLSFHDGFLGADNWAGFLPGADRIALDLHNYLCFTTQSASPMSARVNEPCSDWGSIMNTSMNAFGVTAAGEFSCAINDCGFNVNGVGLGTRYEGTYPGYTTKVGDCTASDEWENWDQSLKASTKQFALASMDSLGVSLFSSHVTEDMLIFRSTSFSGRGKLGPSWMGPFEHLTGPINLVMNKAGCPKTPVTQLVCVETQIRAPIRSLPRKLVVLVLVKFLPALVRSSHGHPLPSVARAPLSAFSHTIPVQVAFRRCPFPPSPLQNPQSTQEMDGRTPQIHWDSQFPSQRVPILTHGWSLDSRSLRHAVRRVRAIAAMSLEMCQSLHQGRFPRGELQSRFPWAWTLNRRNCF
jgi:hypothetical protein